MIDPGTAAIALMAIIGSLGHGEDSPLPRTFEFSFGQVTLRKEGDLATITRSEAAGDPRRSAALPAGIEVRTVLISTRDCAWLWRKIDSDEIRAYRSLPPEAFEHTPPDLPYGDHLRLVVEGQTRAEWSYADRRLVQMRRGGLEEIEESALDVWGERLRNPVTPKRMRISLTERLRAKGGGIEIQKNGDTATIAVHLQGTDSGGVRRHLSRKEIQSVWGTVMRERILDQEFGASQPSDPTASADTVRSLLVAAEGVTLVEFSRRTDFHGREAYETLRDHCRGLAERRE